MLKHKLDLTQNSLIDGCPITAAVKELASVGSSDALGAIFTRPEVVDFILDISGYTSDQLLHKKRLLEPSSGGGEFLLAAIDRLIKAWHAAGNHRNPLADLSDCIRAVELHEKTFSTTRHAVVDRLVERGIAPRTAKALSDRWLIHSDFLLMDLPGVFDTVIGNPPYVRQELIPAPLLAEYRSRYRTMYDRADLYIPFIERSLEYLAPKGALGFICADRWMKNRYGGPLRAYIAKSFRLKAYVDMTNTLAFQSDVIAYPAITVITREQPGATRISSQPLIEKTYLKKLARAITAKARPKENSTVSEITNVSDSDAPWILDSSSQMTLMRRLEKEYPTLEMAHCKVGIGVATGADEAYIGPFEALDVEPDRKLPIVMTKDIQTGRVQWRGLGVVNPFIDGPGSGLVSLEEYPKLKRYLEVRKDKIAKRHVAQRAPTNWYRTIDRITSSLTSKPKLLIPDIKGKAQIVYEDGRLYPHHNLYFVTSEIWELRALQAVLLSDIARLFVETYSTKMRGGYFRFQAQYLRRIRIPNWESVPNHLRENLKNAAKALDLPACNEATFELYQLTKAEKLAITSIKKT